MADKLFAPATIVFTAGTTFTYSHGLTAAGAPVAPDLVVADIQSQTAAASVALSLQIVGKTTGVVTACMLGAANVGTVVLQNQYLHSIQRIT